MAGRSVEGLTALQYRRAKPTCLPTYPRGVSANIPTGSLQAGLVLFRSPACKQGNPVAGADSPGVVVILRMGSWGILIGGLEDMNGERMPGMAWGIFLGELGFFVSVYLFILFGGFLLGWVRSSG